MKSLAESASYYRAALWLGLLPGEAVVRWAESRLEVDEDVPAALCELATTSGADLSRLRAILHDLADTHESATVVQDLLQLVAEDLAAGRRSTRDTITVLGQMYTGIALAEDLRHALHPFGIQYSLGAVGVEGDYTVLESQLRSWLLPRLASRVKQKSSAY